MLLYHTFSPQSFVVRYRKPVRLIHQIYKHFFVAYNFFNIFSRGLKIEN